MENGITVDSKFSDMPGVVAIIPARGGSKGIPGKNIKELCGKPLIAWTIEAAQNAETVDEVYVTTDSEAIAQVAINYGANVIERPDYYATDTCSSELAIIHAIENGAKGEVTAFLQCTSPLILPSDIDGCVKKVLECCDSCFTATRFDHFIWKEGKNGSLIAVDHVPSNRQMRQQREKRLLEVGMCYAFRTETFMQLKMRFCGKVDYYEIDRLRAIEIDEISDWELAEILMQTRFSEFEGGMEG